MGIENKPKKLVDKNFKIWYNINIENRKEAKERHEEDWQKTQLLFNAWHRNL